ncbi:putative permease [Rivularia sp. PCC 7116]|uniref:TSUP family transporter n=1 Tax=Rivularia sp. PCC 7116 TaxID=373994 RepID=UPI00029F2617|nr:TSUP family transporter [Rivularia sp. PCC 7116]AFY54213.1 putative permease [Rivularia sp. PCC 7116]
MIYKFLRFATKTAFSQHFIGISVLVAVIVWTCWLFFAGPRFAFANLINNWGVAVTMVFGSMIAGGTSMGGGAVAFPVFTKVLQIPPHESMVFSLAIQSIGMTAASLTIMAMGTKVEWRFILWASLGGILGIILGSVFLAPILPPPVIKVSFTMIVSSFAVILFALNRKIRSRNLIIPVWGQTEQLLSIIAGIIGGTISGLVGSGMDILGFSVMVLLFGLCEKVSTPTSVILMAINAVAGFILHKFFIGDFVQPVISYWLAAVPVVVVGAPTGAILCSFLQRHTVARILIGLIFIELVSSFLLLPLHFGLICYALIIFIVFLLIYYRMYKTNLYIKKDL